MIDQTQLEKMSDMLMRADGYTVFVAGAGRSGCAASAFANRLLHLGFRVCRIGEITTVPVARDDVLVVLSGSGRTSSLVTMVSKAERLGARIAVITMQPEGEIGEMADEMIVLPGMTRLQDKERFRSFQPVGSCFEQLAWLTCDALVFMMREKAGISDEEMLARHANLE